jgi:hypothetical protein
VIEESLLAVDLGLCLCMGVFYWVFLLFYLHIYLYHDDVSYSSVYMRIGI